MTVRVAPRTRRMSRFAWIALLVLLAAACRATGHARTNTSVKPQPTLSPTATPPPLMTAPTDLTVVRFSAFPGNRVAPFQKTAQDVASVRRLYAAILAEPPYPWRDTWCPNDIGLVYELTFTARGSLVKQVLLTGGCPTVRLSFPKECLRWTPALTDQIAATLDVPTSTFTTWVDSAAPGEPVAPEFPAPPIYAATTC